MSFSDDKIISVYSSPKEITVNGESLRFEYRVPDVFAEPFSYLLWWSHENYYRYYTTSPSGSSVEHVLEPTEENYNLYVKPFVDQWEAEKDRIENEQIQAEQEYAKFENRRERALTTIQNDYDAVLSQGFVRTSLGFDADITPASVATLLGTQVGLAYTARTLKDGEIPKTVFRDFYGLKRELDAVQVELLICQINGAQNYIRELKYSFRDQIKDCIDNESLNATIARCEFSTLDYSKLSEDGKPMVLPFVETQSIKDRIDAFKR